MRRDFIPTAREAFITRIASALANPGERVVLTGVHGLGMTFVFQRIGLQLAARGVTVLRSTGSAAAIPYQFLHDLIPTAKLDTLELSRSHRKSLDTLVAGEPVTHEELSLATGGLLRELAAAGPVALLIDDVHLLDPASKKLAVYLSSRPGTLEGLSIVVSEFVDPTVGVCDWEYARTVVAPLPAIDSEDLARIVHSRTGVRPSRLEAARIHTDSCGNPAFALSRLGAARGAASSTASRDRDTAHGLDARAIELLALAAEAPGLSEVELRALPDHAAQLPHLLRSGIIHSAAGRLALPPPGPAGIGLDEVDRERMRELHGALALVRTDRVGRAEHLDRATLPGPSERVAVELAAAASSAISAGDGGAAAELMLRSLARSGSDADADFDRRASTASLLFAMGEFGMAATVTDPIALPTLSVPRLDRLLVTRAASVAAARGEQVALAELDELAAACEGDEVRTAIVRIVRAVTDGADHSPDRFASAYAELADNRHAPQTRHRATAALVHASVKAGRGMDDEAIREFGVLERELPGLSVANGSLAFVGMHAYQVERLDLSRSSLEAARRAAQSGLEDFAAGKLAVHLAIVETHAGRLDDADAWLKRWDAVDPVPSTPPPPVLAARLLLALLRDDDAALRGLLALPSSGNESQAELVRLAVRGRLAARRGRFEEARLLLTSARDLATEMQILEPGARLHLDIELAHAQVETGRLAEAEQTVLVMERISGGGRPLLDGVAARIRGLMARERGDLLAAADGLRRALAVLPRDGFGSERAVSGLELASVLIALGDATDARRAALASRRAARAAGDSMLERRVGELDLRDRTPTPEALLSPREYEVAQAVAEGRTNQEIAADSWVSVRTIETQLSSAYRKLGVRTRAELAVLVHSSYEEPAEKVVGFSV